MPFNSTLYTSILIGSNNKMRRTDKISNFFKVTVVMFMSYCLSMSLIPHILHSLFLTNYGILQFKCSFLNNLYVHVLDIYNQFLFHEIFKYFSKSI